MLLLPLLIWTQQVENLIHGKLFLKIFFPYDFVNVLGTHAF